MANYITNIPGPTIDQYLLEGHEALSKANHAIKALGNTQTATAVTILGTTSTIVPAVTQIPAATTTKAGVMSAADKVKLEGAAAEEYVAALIQEVNGNKETELTHHSQSVTNIAAFPYAGGVDLEVYKGGSQSPSHVDIPSATPSAAGVMSAADKVLINVIRQNYINAGATYNATTGYYSLNGLTDITEEQMAVIYADTYRKQCGLGLSSIYAYSKARTNFPMRNRGNNEGEMNFRNACFSCQKLEVVKYGEVYKPGISGSQYYGYTTDISEAFYYCVKLKQIIGVIDMERITDAGKASNAFYNCNLLEDVQILGLKTNLALKSPAISYDSVKFLVDHAANTTAITVTVDVQVWNWLTGGSAPPEGHTPEEWQAINSDAVAKNISFAY